MTEDFNLDSYHADLTARGITNKGNAVADHSLLKGALGLTGAAPFIKSLQIGDRVNKLLRKDWRDRTLKDDVYYEKEVYGIEPKGLEGWRPFKAFTPKMLKTGPTQAAESALKIVPNRYGQLKINKKRN